MIFRKVDPFHIKNGVKHLHTFILITAGFTAGGSLLQGFIARENSMTGKIHSLESFETVDGPGIRFVVFMQGCPLRCLYCHNPDTWDVKAKPQYEMSPEELLVEALRYKSFIAKGGVTVTGGEPLLQAEFLKEFFILCRREKTHTALDTSGAVFNEKVKELLHYTDLVLLDIKSLSRDMHQKNNRGCSGSYFADTGLPEKREYSRMDKACARTGADGR